MRCLEAILRDLEATGSRSSFLLGLKGAGLPFDLECALARAAQGETDAINDRLFDRSANAPDGFAWLAPVTGGRFVWMLGEVAEVEAEIALVRERALAGAGLATTIDKRPPAARFVHTRATSTWQRTQPVRNLAGSESFAEDMTIFQTTYRGDAPRQDVDQRFCINLPHLAGNTATAYRIAARCLPSLSDHITRSLLPQARFLSALHIELHNIGHFCGPFPFELTTKDRLIYQPLEEFRACLAATELLSEADVDGSLKRDFFLHVLVVRIFLYAYRAWKRVQKDAAQVREIIVGCIFAEQFIRQTRAGLEVRQDGASEVLADIHAAEALAKVGALDLSSIAERLLTLAFPGAVLGPVSAILFSRCESMCASEIPTRDGVARAGK